MLTYGETNSRDKFNNGFTIGTSSKTPAGTKTKLILWKE